MRVLAVSHNKLEREHTAKALEQLGHKVDQACDARAAMTRHQCTGTEVVLVDMTMPGSGARELVSKLSQIPQVSRPWIILLVDSNPGAELRLLLDKGVDDFLRRPFWKEELAARVEAPLRLRMKPGAERAVRDWSDARDPITLWEDVGAVVGSDLSSMAGSAVEVDRQPAPSAWPRDGMVATIALVHSETAAEVRVLVNVDVDSLKQLAQITVGTSEPDEALTQDILRELANVAGGALKRAAPAEESMTLGLPTTLERGSAAFPLERARRCFRCRVAGTSISLTFALETHRVQRHRLPAFRLREGMILAADLCNEAGLLLLPRGVRLTSSAAERLVGMLARDFLVEVDAAA